MLVRFAARVFLVTNSEGRAALAPSRRNRVDEYRAAFTPKDAMPNRAVRTATRSDPAVSVLQDKTALGGDNVLGVAGFELKFLAQPVDMGGQGVS